MIFTQETIPISTKGRMPFTYNLWDEPIRFTVYFVAFVFFEWFLIKVHSKMMDEERNSKKKKRKRNKNSH